MFERVVGLYSLINQGTLTLWNELLGFFTVVPYQYRVLTLLYAGFLLSVIFVNIVAFFISTALQWYEKRL